MGQEEQSGERVAFPGMEAGNVPALFREGAEFKELRERFPEMFRAGSQREEALLPSGVEKLDAALQGGVPLGALTEILAGAEENPGRRHRKADPRAGLGPAGAQLPLLAFLRAARESRRYAALIDGDDSFDPGTTEDALLEHLLWVRCRKTDEALAAMDILLRDENFALVLLDLRRQEARRLNRIPATRWYRFQRVAENSGTAGVVFTNRPTVASARARIRVTADFGLDAIEIPRDRLADSLEMETLRARVFSAETTPAARAG